MRLLLYEQKLGGGRLVEDFRERKGRLVWIQKIGKEANGPWQVLGEDKVLNSLFYLTSPRRERGVSQEFAPNGMCPRRETLRT